MRAYCAEPLTNIPAEPAGLTRKRGEQILNKKTVVVTDGRYRAALAAVRSLGEAGYRVVVTQTQADSPVTPAAFHSRYAAKLRWIPGSCKDADYAPRLLSFLQELDHPILFCVGADTLNMVSRQRERFAQVADFLIAPPQVLDELNDKAIVHQRALALDIPVPKEYQGVPEEYPVVLKPHCGEKFGLKAADRYVIAQNEEEYLENYQAMSSYDTPIVQEKLEGSGEGINLLMGKDSQLLCAMCHRRMREYPITGGPSTCCMTFFNEKKVDQAHRLLASFGFVGMAMVEFKDGRVLEVNPRVWGSFPLTACCGSPFASLYAQAAAGEPCAYTPMDYQLGIKMRYLFNDGLATLSYLRHGKVTQAMAGLLDLILVPEALKWKGDMGAYRAYLKNSLRNH